MNYRRGLADGESALFNFNESDFEDIDDEEEENFSTVQEDIPEEVLPRSPDGSEWESSDEEPLVSVQRVRRLTNRPLRWDHTNNFQSSPSNIYEDPPLVEPTICKPSHEYFCHYIKPEFFEQMSHCTNICSTYRTGRSLNTNLEEMRTFVGVSMVMGKCKMKQVVRGKPNPEGIKVFLLANPNGLPLDLYLYQGGGTTVESALHPMPEKLDLGGRVVLKLVDTLPKHSSIYIDR
ncbi:unnamed protein product [Parnassius apollo]|uniref:(apollo) hypothetical protein n=1 Tax=Parnassius apollo TaxID=110799 RepID=A0A8S3XFY1_PARAO|nr:unnamed protein product [Parnassius apollo]